MIRMDNIFISCRKGDLSRVKYLVEQKEIDLNIRDAWDSTPLFYACLCGHIEIVKYLLENGAKCQKNTFDGERCLYGSLTNEIKKLLLDAKVITAQTKRRDDYEDFCERMLRAENFSDITFVLEEDEENCPQKRFRLHRCILSVRSEHFKNLLETRWKQKSEVRNSMISPQVFDEFLKYVYTSRIVCQRDHLDLFFRLADQCLMPELREQLESAARKAASFEGSKKGVRVSTISVENDKSIFELQQAYGQLIEQGLPPELTSWPAANALPLMPTLPSTYFDLCLVVDGYRFYCHKLFLCIRSSYFNAMVQDHFHESYTLEDNIPVLKLHDVSPAVITCILYYVYTNNPQLCEETVLDVLRWADIYLLPGLKRECGVFLANRVDSDNILMLFKISRLYVLPRLENRCTEFMANNLECVVNNEEFHEMVLQDASQVKGRQDTDSIDIIDEMRYHITIGIQTYSEVQDANDKLRLIDNMLEFLGLDA